MTSSTHRRDRLARLLSSPLVRQAGVYTAAQFAGRALPFLLLPVLTRYLTPADYGTVALFLLGAALLEPIVGLAVAGSVTVAFFDRRVDIAAYVGTAARLILSLGGIAAAVIFVAHEPLTGLTAVPSPWLMLLVPLILARQALAVPLGLMRVREQAWTFALVQVAQTAAVLVLSVALVVWLRRGWPGRIEAEVIAAAAFAILGVRWLRQTGMARWVFVRAHARRILTFGLPLIPHTVGAVLIFQVDRLLLTNLVSVTETGVYTAGYQLAVVVELVGMSFNNAFAPWLYRRLPDADAITRARLVRLTYVGFLLMAAIAVAVAALMPMVADRLLGEAYSGSGGYVGWLAFGFWFSSMYYLVTNYIFYAGSTAALAAVTVGVGVLKIPLTYVLIEMNGAIGAAQATAIALGASFALTWLVSQRAYPMPWLAALRGDTGGGG